MATGAACSIFSLTIKMIKKNNPGPLVLDKNRFRDPKKMDVALKEGL